ncbi:hypothetical protein ACPPVO_09930 [Dactylosporangium sp. McL0621]|uniref:hypothetical protein n=1 Tax=Dactylosporangium sp. McL0621 TaxID=3415678 RepID=UPI003CF75941
MPWDRPTLTAELSATRSTVLSAPTRGSEPGLIAVFEPCSRPATPAITDAQACCYARRQGEAQGRAEGSAEGEAAGKAKGGARAVLIVLDARGVEVPEDVRADIANCTDLVQLGAWIRLAATARRIEDLGLDAFV